MSIVRATLGSLALALTLAHPCAAERPGITSWARDESDAAAVIAKFKKKDPGLAKVFAQSAGYVVFPTVAKGGLGYPSAGDVRAARRLAMYGGPSRGARRDGLAGSRKRGWCRSAADALRREGRHINDRMHAIGKPAPAPVSGPTASRFVSSCSAPSH
jgi:hypothetical protein